MPPLICRIPCLKNSNQLPEFSIISLVFFSTSTPNISIFDYLVNHHHFSPECGANVSSSSSTKFLTKPQNAASFLNFLKETGFAKNQIEALLPKVPNLLSANLQKRVQPKFMIFQELGFDSTDLVDIISTCPQILNASANRVQLSIIGLKKILGPNADIRRFLKDSTSGRLLVRDLDRNMVPNIEYLKSCGICSVQIATFVFNYPLTFLANQEKFKGYVKRVDEMGVDRECKMFLYCVRVMSCMTRENWELKLKLFRELGFSDQNILHAFRIVPQAFAVSEKKIREVTRLLLSVENLDISYIASYPLLLCYSVEKRLKPRLRVLKALESKNLLKKRPALTSFFGLTDAEFINKYVSPYPDEVGNLYVASQGS